MQETDKGYLEWRRLKAEVDILGYILVVGLFGIMLLSVVGFWMVNRQSALEDKVKALTPAPPTSQPNLVVNEGTNVGFQGTEDTVYVTVKDGQINFSAVRQ